MEIMQREYADQMEEIKRRNASIKKLSEIAVGQLHVPVVTECVYLQFRKILELIAMSSLVANRQTMEKMNRSRKQLGNQWNGDAILKLVEGINPDFYPVPIIQGHPSIRRRRRSSSKRRTVSSAAANSPGSTICAAVLFTQIIRWARGRITGHSGKRGRRGRARSWSFSAVTRPGWWVKTGSISCTCVKSTMGECICTNSTGSSVNRLPNCQGAYDDRDRQTVDGERAVGGGMGSYSNRWLS